MRARIRDTNPRRDLPRLRPALPALDRAGLQGRPELRRVPADHLRRPGRYRRAGPAYSFGVVKAAQARGDLEVLEERGRRALRVHLRRMSTAADLAGTRLRGAVRSTAAAELSWQLLIEE